MPATDPRTLTTLPLPQKGWEPPTAETRVRLIKPLLPPPPIEQSVGVGEDAYWSQPGMTWSQALDRDPNKTEGPATDYGLDAWDPWPGPGSWPYQGPGTDYGAQAWRTPYDRNPSMISVRADEPQPARDDWARNWESWDGPQETAAGPPDADTSGVPARDDWRYEFRPQIYDDQGDVMPWAQPLDTALDRAVDTYGQESGARPDRQAFYGGMAYGPEPWAGVYYARGYTEDDAGTPEGVEVGIEPRQMMGQRPSEAARKLSEITAHEAAHGVSLAHDPYHAARTVELMARHPELYDLFLNVIQDLDSRGRWHPYGRIPAGRPGYVP